MMVAEMRSWLGTGEKPAGSNYNKIVQRYNAEVDRIGRGPWCDMTVTIAGIDSGNSSVVGKFAYTVWHAQWFKDRGVWHTGTKGIAPGAVVFFDWKASRSISNIDHVGVVESVSGSRITTIEGNMNDVCKRVVRDATYIVGYGMPAYSKPALAAPGGSPLLEKGSSGSRVLVLQRCLNAVISARLEEDGDFGDLTKDAVKKFQKGRKGKDGKALEVDGQYGKDSAWAMAEALKTLKKK